MDYVSERACIYELSRTLRAWERKVEIAEVSLVKLQCVISICLLVNLSINEFIVIIKQFLLFLNK